MYPSRVYLAVFDASHRHRCPSRHGVERDGVPGESRNSFRKFHEPFLVVLRDFVGASFPFENGQRMLCRLPVLIPTVSSRVRPDYKVFAHELFSTRTGMLYDRHIHADLCRAFQRPARLTLQNQKAKHVETNGLALAAVPTLLYYERSQIEQAPFQSMLRSRRGGGTPFVLRPFRRTATPSRLLGRLQHPIS